MNCTGAALAYDANGNMTSYGMHTYTWNARNQLASIAGNTTDSFEYGPFGRRLQKTISGTTTDYLYDGVNPVQELSGSTVTANLLTGLGVDEYFQRTDSTSTSDFLMDALGSTLALADTSGAVQTEYTYSPFGSTTAQGAGSTNSFQFTGRENDGDGLYYYRARYYDPVFARFMSQDPSGLSGGLNPYGYVGGAASEFVDPFGLDKKSSSTKGPSTCSPPTSWVPKTVGVKAGVAGAATKNGKTTLAGAAVTGVISTSGVGGLANVGTQVVPSRAAPGEPEAVGLYVGAGFQMVVSNGAPSQLLGRASTSQVSVGFPGVFAGTVAITKYPNGVYEASFTPWPELPASASGGGLYERDVSTTTRGFTTSCH